jgi:hypothetical protein
MNARKDQSPTPFDHLRTGSCLLAGSEDTRSCSTSGLIDRFTGSSNSPGRVTAGYDLYPQHYTPIEPASLAKTIARWEGQTCTGRTSESLHPPVELGAHRYTVPATRRLGIKRRRRPRLHPTVPCPDRRENSVR